MKKRTICQTLCLPGLLLLAALAYRPGLTGGFVFDDIRAIVINLDLRFEASDPAGWWRAVQSGFTGLWGRPLAMLSFAMDAAWHGLDPYAFKLTNLAIHMANILMVFFLTREVLRAAVAPMVAEGREGGVALGAAAVWGLHPMQLTSVLYVVQRMTSLSALFTLLGLIAWLHFRVAWQEGRQRQVIPVGLLMLVAWAAAVLAKENALLFPLFSLALEVAIGGLLLPAIRRLLAATLVCSAAVAAAILFLKLDGWHAIEEAYRFRDFTLTERLLTESRLMWHYLFWLAFPRIESMGLYHDDIEISHGLVDPPATLAALAGLALLAWLAWRQHQAWPWLAGGLLFFFGGHLMESTVIPLEIAFEHRNYLPSYGIALTAVVAVSRALAARRALLVGLAVVTALSLVVLTHSRARDWSEPLRMALAEAAHHPGSARANYQAGQLYWTALRHAGEDEQREKWRLAAADFFRAAMRSQSCDLSGALGLIGALGKPAGVAEALPVIEERIDRCAIHENSSELLRFLINCEMIGQCNIGAITLEHLSGRFDASPRLAR